MLAAFGACSMQTAPEAMEALTAGSLATLFWAGLVLAGLVAPLAMEVALRTGRATIHPCIPALLVLVGGACLRICIVFAA